MTEILSQNEIDALLNALSSGEVDVKEMQEEEERVRIREYDFKNPQKIAKDQLKTLEIIHEKFARLLQTFLSGYLRTTSKSAVETVDQYAYSEYGNAISNPSFLSIVNFEPLGGQIVVDISPNLAFVMIDRLLGGTGENPDEVRGFTEIELLLLKRVMKKVVEIVAEAWEDVIFLTPRLEKIETNSQFAQIVSPNETVTLITLSLTVGEAEGFINICIPHMVLEPVLNKLSTKLWFSLTSRPVTEEDRDTIKQKIENTKVPVIAELGRTVLNVGEILSLRRGDVFALDDTADSELKIKVGPYTKFHGKAGKSKKRLAVKITKAYKDGEEIDE
ncbi:flagellar motor switch protein FliM [Andreesenia angusta]|uniref:Flagellar motor switch protein FliM n=1 Tax=Andreesenia angusta TaxID=39480 RepID=A0A1S1V849_9FIRM|nr:flagellar motor switch protein FliM [Andreesenia angusta]OHW62768.1 flagellar motor switch protein FliM [Andreesenia angusta]